MLFAPRDIQFVNIPAGHPEFPSCGVAHARPSGPDGEPVHPWSLQCEPCERWLRENDSARWVPTLAEIPPTYDEARAAEQLAVRGSADRDDILMRALAKIAGIDVPASMGRPLPAAAPVTGLMACPGCQQAQPAGQAFCGHCGTAMRRPVPAAEIAPAASS
jgi:hypothetical protein